jgi:DNA repair exonuclease SbcCD ATPase subunit
MFRITNIKVEGFRGINEPLEFKVGGKPVFLFGNNGVGKTSLLQAIEWCMFGQFAYLPAEEYKYEDAIVNSFHSSETARVELTLKGDDGKTLKLTRTRKKGKSTTRGKNPLTLELDGKTLIEHDAEEQLGRMFKLTPEEYYSRTHLHQEAVRDLLFGQVTDRSAMIDKMLGLYRLRQLMESLPVSAVDREIKDVQEDIHDTNQEKDTYEKTLEQGKKDLQGLGEELGKMGVAPEKADLVIFVDRFTFTHQALVELAELVECKIRAINAPKTIDDAKRIADPIARQLAQIEDERTAVYGRLQRDIAEIDKLHDDYRNGLKEEAELQIEFAKLTEQKETVLKQLKDLQEKEEKVKNSNAELRAEANIVARLKEERRNIEGKLQEIKGRYGDKQSIVAAIRQLEESARKTNQSIDQKGLSAKLVGLGAQYFEASEEDICPVCGSQISLTSVRASLESHVKEQKEVKAIEQLREDLRKLDEQMRSFRTAGQTFDEFTSKLQGNTNELDERKKKLKSLGLDTSQITNMEQLQSFIEFQQEESEKLEKEIREKILGTERQRIGLESAEKKLSELLSLEKRLQQLTGTSLKRQELLARVEQHKRSVQSRADNIAKLGEKASAIREGITTMKSVVDFLIKKADVEKMEKTMLPGIIKKLEALDSKMKKMQDLGAAIHDIHGATMSAQQDFLKTRIGTLQRDINKAYSKLVPHPYFEKLQLVPEEARGEYLYRIQALSKDGKERTYVQTRFSLAQMNVTAIALFLAMAGRVSLGFLVFDDPSQSLDLEHKGALANVLAEIGTEQQLFVATQDEQFQEELKRQKTKMKAQIIELAAWSTKGPETGRDAS